MSQLEFQIINFEDKYAILDHPVYKNLKWPIKELPAEIEIGSFVKIGNTNQSEKAEANHNPEILKKLLEDLIN